MSRPSLLLLASWRSPPYSFWIESSQIFVSESAGALRFFSTEIKKNDSMGQIFTYSCNETELNELNESRSLPNSCSPTVLHVGCGGIYMYRYLPTGKIRKNRCSTPWLKRTGMPLVTFLLHDAHNNPANHQTPTGTTVLDRNLDSHACSPQHGTVVLR